MFQKHPLPSLSGAEMADGANETLSYNKFVAWIETPKVLSFPA